jgi:hypothetical protein
MMRFESSFVAAALAVVVVSSAQAATIDVFRFDFENAVVGALTAPASSVAAGVPDDVSVGDGEGADGAHEGEERVAIEGVGDDAELLFIEHARHAAHEHALEVGVVEALQPLGVGPEGPPRGRGAGREDRARRVASRRARVGSVDRCRRR